MMSSTMMESLLFFIVSVVGFGLSSALMLLDGVFPKIKSLFLTPKNIKAPKITAKTSHKIFLLEELFFCFQLIFLLTQSN